MARFFVTGPSDTVVTGTAGTDRLIYKLASGPGGVQLDSLVRNPGGGYDGAFVPTDGDATAFTGIENFTFVDQVGGNDRLIAGDGIDVLKGRAGNDRLFGGGGNDNLLGGRHRDRLFGEDGTDELHGGLGRDRLFGGDGNDMLFGEDGTDTIFGGRDNDFIDGGAGNDVIFGGGGDDFIIADRGADQVSGGFGKDQIEIQFDAPKTIDGGNGRDFLFAFFDDYDAGDMTLFFNMKTGKFVDADSGANASTVTSIEDFAMQGQIDARVLGTGRANQIFGSFGDDVLRGRGGNDALFGDEGDDILIGNRRADFLDGGLGNDILRGGFGRDTFQFSGGHDMIASFQDDVDTVQILGSLLPDGTTVEDVIADAAVVDGDTVFTLDADNVLTINGLADPGVLIDDLIIV